MTHSDTSRCSGEKPLCADCHRPEAHTEKRLLSEVWSCSISAITPRVRRACRALAAA